MLLAVPGDESCGLPPALLQAVTYHTPTVGPSAFPALCLLIVHAEISALPLPLLWCIFSIPAPSTVH
jgi:hypothetical protein